MLETLQTGFNYGLVALGSILTVVCGVMIAFPIVVLIGAIVARFLTIGGEKRE